MVKLNVDQALLKAKSHIKKGENIEALKLYKVVLEAFPKNKRAQQGFANLNNLQIPNSVEDPPQEEISQLLNLLNQGQLNSVVEKALILRDKFPKAIMVWNVLGVANKGLDKTNEALKAFKKVTELNPNYAEGLNNYGVILKEQGKLEEAIKFYKKAILIMPNYAQAFNNLGGALKEQGKLKDAKSAYNKALKLNPNYSSAYYNKGNIQRDQGKLEEAIQSYKKALSLNPNHLEAHNNLGSIFQEQEKLDEAIQSYKKVLSLNPNHVEAHNNLGSIFQEQEKLDEAIQFYKKALSLNPNHVEAYNNLGSVFQEQEKLDEAIESYKKALSLNPNHVEAYNNLGSVFQEQEKLDEAIESYKKALLFKPDYSESHLNIAVVLSRQDKHDEALNYFKKALALKPDFTAAYYYFASALINLKFKQQDKEVEKIIVSILDQKTIKRTRTIIPSIISLIKLEPYLSNKLNFVSSDYNLVDLKETIFNLSKISILLKVMGLVSIPDLKLEQLFTIIRRSILLYNSELGDSREVLKFQTALALQCFNNEYIYSENNKEINALKKLEVSVLSTLESGKKPSSSSILCLASYKALYKYDWYDKIKIEKEIDEVFKRQVIEPIYERELKSSIPVLGRIKNKISTKVREQYEENPYPRWVNLELSLRPFSISKWANLMKLRLFDKNIFNTKVPNVLIAGCGTGQQSIERKTHYKNSQILAIDLSLSSLAYAKRKTEELQVSGIEYMQSDILELDKIEKKFDIIECAGVLHHMDDPLSGWRVLTNCLKKGGLMRIGLYSESARQIIVKIKQEIKAKGIGSTKTEMKSFRNDIIRSNKEHHIKIKPISDFYSLSEFRDLLFHVQEHRFTMSQIKNCLANLGLKFCGFEEGDIVQNFISKNFKKDDLYNLDKWNIYEEANPGAFKSMYQFWCQKV